MEPLPSNKNNKYILGTPYKLRLFISLAINYVSDAFEIPLEYNHPKQKALQNHLGLV
jgi:hypothetical protein